MKTKGNNYDIKIIVPIVSFIVVSGILSILLPDYYKQIVLSSAIGVMFGFCLDNAINKFYK